jgi:hypothetical protein
VAEYYAQTEEPEPLQTGQVEQVQGSSLEDEKLANFAVRQEYCFWTILNGKPIEIRNSKENANTSPSHPQQKLPTELPMVCHEDHSLVEVPRVPVVRA